MSKVVMRLQGGEELIVKLSRMETSVKTILERAARAGGQVIAEAANSLAPEPLIEVKVVERKKDHVVVSIGPPAEKWYWRFVETGAQPHEITGKPLAFEGEAGLVITRRVSHPGMAARPFLRPALDERKDEAADAVGEEIRRIVGA